MRIDFIIIAGIVPLFVLGCVIDDKDRCHDGLVWDDVVKACYEVDSDTKRDSATETTRSDSEVVEQQDAGEDAGEDAGGDTGVSEDKGTDTTPSPTFGTPCRVDAECTGEVDFCQLNVLAPADPGICTVQYCAPSDCPEAYQCCDCSNLGQTISCIPDEAAAQAALFGCSCS